MAIIDVLKQGAQVIEAESIEGYDIIGDVHGCASVLVELLEKLNYRLAADGVYRYAGESVRKVIFLGDLVDRGPEILQTLRLVKAMVDAGEAYIVLGNHEFSAIAYFTPLEKGFLRPHTLRSDEQINETLQQLEGVAEEWQIYLQWFKTLPLFLEFGEFRVVHACWDQGLISEYLRRFETPCISPDRINECVDHKSLSFRVIDRLTRGISLHLPEGIKIKGRDGYLRHNFRVNFWTKDPVTYKDVHFQPDKLPASISQRLLSDDEKRQLVYYGESEKFLFIGHYWLKGKPLPVSNNIACLDYSAVHNGKLVAYRFNCGDKALKASAFVCIKTNDFPEGTINE